MRKTSEKINVRCWRQNNKKNHINQNNRMCRINIVIIMPSAYASNDDFSRLSTEKDSTLSTVYIFSHWRDLLVNFCNEEIIGEVKDIKYY